MKNKKAIAVLLNPIILITLIGLILLFLGVKSGLLAIYPNINFAGFSWQVSGTGNVKIVDEKVILTDSISGSGNSPSNTNFAEISTDITGMDEILVIAEADAYASAYRAGAGSGLDISVKGSQSGVVSIGDAISASSSGSESAQTVSKHIDARVYKLINNFDGSWSTLESLGVGDVFIVKSTRAINGNPILNIRAYTVHNSIQNEAGASARITATIYNVVVKENAFAICKADEFWQDKNQDGKPTSDECFDLQTIVLNSEEAIKESYDEKIARLTAELEAKNNGLTADIELLKQQLANAPTTAQITALQQQITHLEGQLASAQDKTLIQAQIDALRLEQTQSSNLQDRLSALEAELKEAKSTLNSVQAGDKNVIAVVEAQEQFEKPSLIKRFFNAIIAWIKNLFG